MVTRSLCLGLGCYLHFLKIKGEKTWFHFRHVYIASFPPAFCSSTLLNSHRTQYIMISVSSSKVISCIVNCTVVITWASIVRKEIRSVLWITFVAHPFFFSKLNFLSLLLGSSCRGSVKQVEEGALLVCAFCAEIVMNQYLSIGVCLILSCVGVFWWNNQRGHFVCWPSCTFLAN